MNPFLYLFYSFTFSQHLPTFSFSLFCVGYLLQPSVRKTHNGGRKHKDSVRLYYMNWLEKEAQHMIDHTGNHVHTHA